MRQQGDRDAKDIRVRAEAARTLIDATRSQSDADAMEMAAFMGLFHPGHPKTDELVRHARTAR